MRNIKKGATSQSVYFDVLDSTSTTGGRKTGLAYNTSSLVAYYVRSQGTATAITLATLAAANTAWSSGGFKEVDATNMPGIYRLDVPDAAFATGAGDDVVIVIKGATGMVQASCDVQLVAWDPQDTVRGGLTALPNAAAEAAGGLYTRGTGAGQINQDANGRVDANAKAWAGTATTLTSGLPDVNMKTITAGIIAAASFAANALDAVWSTATRVLTAGTNIALAKGTGVTGFNDLDAAGVRSAVGLASANLDTQLTAIDDYIDTEVAAIKTQTDKLTFTVANQVDVNVIDWKGSAAPAMTGDAYARLGAPAGVSVSADVAAVKAVLPAALVSGRIDASVGAMAANVMTAAAAASDLTTELQAGLATATAVATLQTSVDDVPTNAELATALSTADGAVLAQVALVKAKTDNLPSDPADESLIITATDAIMTRLGVPADTDIATDIANISGGTAPSASAIADEVQTRTIAAVTLVNGLAANSVTAAALASDAVTEIQTGLATASALSTVSGKIDVIDDFVDTEVAAIKAKTDTIPSDPADASDIAAAFTSLQSHGDSAWATATGFSTLDAAGVRSAVGLASANLDTQLDALPTNAELATALAGADDAMLVQVALVKAKTDNLPSDPADQSLIIAATDAIKADTAAVKTKTDNLAFTITGLVDVNIQAVNDVEVVGTGVSGDEWSPAP